jgi:hypothetical protein
MACCGLDSPCKLESNPEVVRDPPIRIHSAKQFRGKECLSLLVHFSFVQPRPGTRQPVLAIMHSSSVRMTRIVTRLAATEITVSFAACLFTAAARLILRLCTGGRGQKLLPTVVAAKVERLSLAFSVKSGCFIHGHSANGVFGHGFRVFHGPVPCRVVVVPVL